MWPLYIHIFGAYKAHIWYLGCFKGGQQITTKQAVMTVYYAIIGKAPVSS